MALLGVNIDHVATIREVRGTRYPDPVAAAVLCELAGADSITVHLREDRRHIQDRDARLLKETIQTRLNLEMALTEEMISIAESIRPHSVCFVPEKRQELTTEGGLDVIRHQDAIQQAILRLNEMGISVSLFIDPDQAQIESARRAGAQMVELHTGRYCDARADRCRRELHLLQEAVGWVADCGLICNAGHGLTLDNILPLAKDTRIHEFNIGHSIISRAVLIGLERAVYEMAALVKHPS